MPPPIPTEAPKNGPPHKPTLAELAERQFDGLTATAPIEEIPEAAQPVSPEVPSNESPKEEHAMKNVDWSKIQQERDAGARIPDLAKKYDVSTFTIYAHTTGGKRGRPKGTQASKPFGTDIPASVKPVVSTAIGGIAGAIAALEAERDRITKAIETLKGL